MYKLQLCVYRSMYHLDNVNLSRKQTKNKFNIKPYINNSL